MTRIKVTAEHIRRGKPHKSHCCPIALAMGEAFRCLVFVEGERAAIDDGGRIALPKACVDFQVAFDAGAVVEPFEFEVE